MSEHNSRSEQRRKRQNKKLNVLITLVVVALLIAIPLVIKIDLGVPEQATPPEKETTDPTTSENQIKEDEPSVETQPGVVSQKNEDENSVVIETIVDAGWEPIGTVQTGPHESKYDGVSDDWKEKKKAIAYATMIDEDDLIYWKIKNGGSIHHSIGIVSTFDESKMYQVYLEWVDNEGWKPVKLEVLRTLAFDY